MNLERKGAAWRAGNGAAAWRPRTSLLNARMFVALLAIDVIAMFASFAGTGVMYRWLADGGTGWLLVFSVLTPLYIGSAINAHAYSPDCLRDRMQCVARGVKAIMIALCVIILIAFMLKASANISRLTVAIGAAFSLLTIAVGRYVFVGQVSRILGDNPYNIVLIADGGHVPPAGDYSVLIAADVGLDPNKHDPMMYDRLATSLDGADRVVVSCAIERRQAWSAVLKGANIQSEILIPELQDLAPLGVSHHGAVPTIVIATGPLGLFERFVKRTFDIVVAGTALIILSPVLLIIAILIKLDSPGPIFFRQVRIGRANQMFRVLKFRSMRAERIDSAGDRSASRGDDRITRVGNIIRKTSVDELPQLINVMSGNMSIVGPRPHALGSRAADKLFWEVDERYWQRHAAKPGLTGLAQVRGYRGATFHEDDLTNRLQADLEYLDHWSLWRDIKIVVMTFRVLLHRNAF